MTLNIDGDKSFYNNGNAIKSKICKVIIESKFLYMNGNGSNNVKALIKIINIIINKQTSKFISSFKILNKTL